MCRSQFSFFFFFNDTATTEIYTLSLHDALPIFHGAFAMRVAVDMRADHDPIRASARQVGKEYARARGMIVAVDDHAGDWEPAVRQTAERLRRFDADAERRDAGAAVASTRP